MIRVWALPLAVLWALQCSVSAEPRPDFALRGPVYGSGKVSNAIGEITSESTTLTANLGLTLQSDFEGLSDLLDAVSELASTLDTKLSNVLGPLGSITDADSASEFGTFGVTLAAIDDARNWLDEGFHYITEGLEPFVHDPLPDQFDDAYGRIDGGLAELGDALQALANVVDNLLNSGSSEVPHCHEREVPPRLVYRVVYAVRNLRAYLPLVAYLIDTTVENLGVIDAYLVRLVAETNVVGNVTQYIAHCDAGLLPIASSVSDAVVDVQNQFNAEISAVSLLSNIQTVSSYSALTSAWSTYSSALDQLSSASTSLYSALYDVGDSLERLLLHPAAMVPTIEQSGVVRALVKTLLSDGPFSRFCFNKYSELLFVFADVGVAGVDECIDREVTRMQYLEQTVLRQVNQLVYDFEDLSDELTVCDRIRRRHARNACVSRLAQLYNSLASNFVTKFDRIFADAVVEATASKYRLLACVTALQFQLIDESSDDLKWQIKQCAHYGPYCGGGPPATKRIEHGDENGDIDDSEQEEESTPVQP